jgi:hypothetical protein
LGDGALDGIPCLLPSVFAEKIQESRILECVLGARWSQEPRLQKMVMCMRGLVTYVTSNKKRLGCLELQLHFRGHKADVRNCEQDAFMTETMNSHDVDQEASRASKEFLDGYVDFAEFIASDAQLSIFRQFRSLAARNLLYLEAELQLLEFEIQAIDDADQALLNNGDDEERKTKTEEAIRAWECFRKQTEIDPRQARKLEMITKLRRLMKEYGMLISNQALPSFCLFERS